MEEGSIVVEEWDKTNREAIATVWRRGEICTCGHLALIGFFEDRPRKFACDNCGKTEVRK